MLENGNIGVLGFKRIIPSFHHSILYQLRWSEAIERNEAYEAFSAVCSFYFGQRR